MVPPTVFVEPDLWSLPSWALPLPVVWDAGVRIGIGLDSSSALLLQAVPAKYPSLQGFPKHTLTEAAPPGPQFKELAEKNTSCMKSHNPCPQIPNFYWKGQEALWPQSALGAVVDHTQHKELGGKPTAFTRMALAHLLREGLSL